MNKRNSNIEYMDAQPLKFAPKKPPAKEPMSKSEADAILNNAVRNLMEKYSIGYNEAFTKLQAEKPGLIQGWQAVTKRSK